MVIEKKMLCTVYLTTTRSTKLIESLCIVLSVDREMGRDDVNLVCMAEGRVRGHDFENDEKNLDSI